MPYNEMTGRVNHRGWIVLESISSSDTMFCVDFFRDPTGGFGFEHFRSDPEDGGLWQPVGGFGSERYVSLRKTCDVASSAVPWLTNDPVVKPIWERWYSSVLQAVEEG